MVTAYSMGGSSDVGVIVWTPAPGMAKAIRSVSALALASRIAWRSDPAPESFVFVTVKVAAATGSEDSQANAKAAFLT